MTDTPLRPMDKRPDDEPFYVRNTCIECGDDLEYEPAAVKRGFYDEFYCPDCDDGIYLDVPNSPVQNLDDGDSEDTFEPLDECNDAD